MDTKTGLKQITAAMELVLDKHQEAKGNSWVSCNIQFLEDKLKEEFEEYQKERKPLAKAEELVDLANIAMMLYDRHLEIWASKTAAFMSKNTEE